MEILYEILCEEEVQSPVECYSQLLFQAREFEKVNGSPKLPRDEPGEVDAENSCDAGPTTDRREQTEGLKSKRPQGVTANGPDDVERQHLAFTRRMLRSWWLISTPFVRNHSTVTERPNARMTLNSHSSVNLEAIVFLGEIQLIE